MVKIPEGYRQQAGLIRALGHPIRLRILDILAQSGECCVCHITAILKKRQPYVSQQLMVLRHKGLVIDRRDGVMVFYRLADPRIADLLEETRHLLLVSSDVTFPAVPQSPVEGCPCPECTAHST